MDTNHIEVLRSFVRKNDADLFPDERAALDAAIQSLSARASAGEGVPTWFVSRCPGWPGGIDFRSQAEALDFIRRNGNEETALHYWVHQAGRIDYTPEQTRAMLTAAPQPAQAGASGGVWATTCQKCRMTIARPGECAIGGQHCQCPTGGVDDATVKRAMDAVLPNGHRVWAYVAGGNPDPSVSGREVMRVALEAVAGTRTYRDAYEGAREDLLDWKRRAQKAEATLRSLGYTGITPDTPPAHGDGELPPLPEAADYVEVWDGKFPVERRARAAHYTADQMREYARRALTTRPTPEAQEARDAANGNHGLDTDEMVRFYERDFYVLSNFSSFRLTWRGIDFDTSEAAYHWEKFDGTAPEVQDMIREARSAHDAFKLAESQKVFRREDWDSVKLDVMRRILRAKADQHEYVRRKLLATGDRLLVEDSWRDDFWGWGPKRDGQNWLGRLWMEVRAALALPAQGREG